MKGSFYMKNASRDQLFNDWYNKAQQNLAAARAKRAANMAHLKSIGFNLDEAKLIAGRHFYFDYKQRLTAFEMFHFDERHLAMTLKKDGVAIFGTGQSFCSNLTVFPDDKIIECVLLRDDSIVKKSEGSALLAGVSIPYFGSLQGTAKTGSNEHETGILSVRLTLNDIQTPSVIFNITGGGMDKSSEAYGKAFGDAQALFGFFDGIVRMNLKAMETASKPKTAEAAEMKPADDIKPASEIKSDTALSTPDTAENIFDTIRRLGKLRDEGLLTQEEFTAQKKNLMDRL